MLLCVLLLCVCKVLFCVGVCIYPCVFKYGDACISCGLLLWDVCAVVCKLPDDLLRLCCGAGEDVEGEDVDGCCLAALLNVITEAEEERGVRAGGAARAGETDCLIEAGLLAARVRLPCWFSIFFCCKAKPDGALVLVDVREDTRDDDVGVYGDDVGRCGVDVGEYSVGGGGGLDGA